MDIVLIVVAVWIALDIAIIGVLSHLSGRDRRPAGPRALVSATSPSSTPSRPVPTPVRLRLVSDPSTVVPDRRLHAVTHR